MSRRIARPGDLFAFLITCASYAGYCEIVMTWWNLETPLHIHDAEFTAKSYIVYPLAVFFARFINPFLIFGSPFAAVIASFLITGLCHLLLGVTFFVAGDDWYVWIVRIAFVFGGIGIAGFAPNWWKVLDMPSVKESSSFALEMKETDDEKPSVFARLAGVLTGKGPDADPHFNSAKAAGLLGIPVGFFIVNFGRKVIELGIHTKEAQSNFSGATHWFIAGLQVLGAVAVYRHELLRQQSGASSMAKRVTPLDVLWLLKDPRNFAFIILGVCLLFIQLTLEFTTQVSQIYFGNSTTMVPAACNQGVHLTSATSGTIFSFGISLGNVLGIVVANRLVQSAAAAEDEAAAEQGNTARPALSCFDATFENFRRLNGRFRLALIGSLVFSLGAMFSFLFLGGWTGFIWAFVVLVCNGLFYAAGIHLIEVWVRQDLNGVSLAGAEGATTAVNVNHEKQALIEAPNSALLDEQREALVIKRRLVAKQIFLSLGDLGPVSNVIFIASVVKHMAAWQCK